MNKQEIIQIYLEQEDNKKVVREFYRCLNENDWHTMNNLFHADYFNPVSEFFNDELNELKSTNRRFIESFYEDNHKKLSELGKKKNMRYVWPPTSIKEMLDVMKLEAEFEKARSKIYHINADGNIVWVTRLYEATEIISGVKTKMVVHDRFLMLAHKIRKTESFHDYLTILSNVGKLIYQQNDQEKISNYINNLRNIGILPEE